MNVTGLEYLIDYNQGFDASQFDRIVLELPPLLTNQLPVYLLKNSVLSLLVVDANSAWARAEKQLFSLYVRITNQPILLILNRVEDNYIDIPGQADIRQAPARVERSVMSQRNSS
jgi:hypothetical protein